MGGTSSLERLAPEDRGNYLLPEGENISFPGPLISQTQKEDVMHFIQRKSQECLQHVEEPNQKEAYFFWKLRELRCNQNGNTLLAEVAVLLFKNYRLLKKLFGFFDQAFEYCKTIATAIASFSQEISKKTTELTIVLSETLHQGIVKEPDWLQSPRQLYADEEIILMTPKGSLMTSAVITLQHPHEECHVTPWEVFESQYTTGELLGKGGYGSVRAGVRKADGKQVAIKHVGKTTNDVFITFPGETQSLPLEVALMEMVSKPSRCEKVLELFEWFNMSDSYILVLERPSPCTDLRQFLNGHNCRLSETLVKQIMRQLVQAARHCNEHGVLHRDIKAENILINTETLELKLIDFGCGCLLQDTPYKCFAGTWAYCPPEWLCEELYLGVPATIWSLGVVLFDMVCGHLPFSCEDDIIDRNMVFTPGLSRGCRDLILWCLHRHPYVRPTFEEILSHEWFEEPQKEVKDQLPLLESQITPWEVFESLYTPGDMLGEGGYGTVCAGYRNADAKQVAIKYVRKSPDNDFITIFGETRSLDWFEMSNCYISVLERPRPCTDVQK
ncbi:serine/threonine-protein kinase pim-1-like isoform X2 [Tachysurus fulvidraco]|uniref:serine/threonine-protein kinase pim-1-like isoform X2 n=1 Tax=Tachysurus fulvidraco TaxID=1234273 RepID=UPI001FEF47F9|nr:serine/threonine-protein kinase pim-1-like isoform X2 [Tachysurus fulvidraco]XP_047666106.1 serine/threonine-protein kinase pim-1-like isoform X2 [Tachysurus fulvidraco]XP_047666563.1 serine/threonine-protein kinase pim-1-like isoform X2 [Tachysurus fulvidraco]